MNLGIRRRLAPLLGNGRRQIELMTWLAISPPGSPIIYYGDELGMGDNIFLGDRNGVRTPMQWSGDRNAGFSRADTAASSYSPLIMDPVYGYQAVNVEAQLRQPVFAAELDPSVMISYSQAAIPSLWPWLHRVFVARENRKVLAYLRK